MRLGVIGGGLQGVEAAFLGREAGWEVLVVDRRADAPARGLCDRFACADAQDERGLARQLRGLDVVVPALEDGAALACAERASRAAGVPFAFDPRAYSVSSSKILSDRLFASLGLPAPKPWPLGGFPLVAKPSSGSGSRGVRICRDRDELDGHLAKQGGQREWVLQEFLDGPSYSLEVVGTPGRYETGQVTELAVDRGYDCKRVLAPASLRDSAVREFRALSVVIAQALELRGLMDVEVIRHEGCLKVLEVDARLPSQTPIAVCRSTGVNLLERLAAVFLPSERGWEAGAAGERGVVLEHLRLEAGRLEVTGEHVLVGAGPLHREQDFFGADEALTNCTAGRDRWVATLIVTGTDRDEAWERRNQTVEEICRRWSVEQYADPVPPVVPKTGPEL